MTRRATAPPERDARVGASGRCLAPAAARDRGAHRLRRGATSDWGLGGHVGAPISREDHGMASGITARLLHVDLTNRTTRVEELPPLVDYVNSVTGWNMSLYEA